MLQWQITRLASHGKVIKVKKESRQLVGVSSIREPFNSQILLAEVRLKVRFGSKKGFVLNGNDIQK